MKGYLVLASLLLTMVVQGCGGGTTTGSPPSCTSSNDSVTVNSTSVSIASVMYPQSSCKTVGSNTDVQASAGGKAGARFSSDATCSLYQLPTSSGTPQPKTADYTALPPGGGLLYVSNAEADCTFNATTSPFMVSACGYGTLFASGNFVASPVAVNTNCNSDPSFNVSVYRGSVMVSIPTLSARTQVMAGYALKFDPRTGELRQTIAQFTEEQIATFDAQLDALLFKATPGDFSSYIKAPALSPSNTVVGPNVAQQQLGPRYGSVGAMCAAVSVPVVFFPGDPYGKEAPRLYGAVCSAKTATVYGVAIYRPRDLAYGGQFYQTSGGGFIASQTLSRTLEFGVGLPLFTWNGQVGQSFTTLGTPGRATPDIYVAKFVYSLGSDSTPRIGLVAFSYGGAAYPPVIQ